MVQQWSAAPPPQSRPVSVLGAVTETARGPNTAVIASAGFVSITEAPLGDYDTLMICRQGT